MIRLEKIIRRGMLFFAVSTVTAMSSALADVNHYKDVVGDAKNEPVVRFDGWNEKGEAKFKPHQLTIHFEDHPDWLLNCGERIRSEIVRRLRMRVPGNRAAPDKGTERRLHEAAIMGSIDEIVIRQVKRRLFSKPEPRSRYLQNTTRGGKRIRRLEIEFDLDDSETSFDGYCKTRNSLAGLNSIFRSMIAGIPPKPVIEDEVGDDESEDSAPESRPIRKPKPKDDPRRRYIEDAQQISTLLDSASTILNTRPSTRCRAGSSRMTSI